MKRNRKKRKLDVEFKNWKMPNYGYHMKKFEIFQKNLNLMFMLNNFKNHNIGHDFYKKGWFQSFFRVIPKEL